MENSRTADIKSRISDDAEKIKGWKLAEIVDHKQLKAMSLPDSTTSGKVRKSKCEKFFFNWNGESVKTFEELSS